MARHLKSIIKNRLEAIVSYYPPYREIAASHARGVRYIVPVAGVDFFYGAMNMVKEGRKYHKHIIVRRVPRNGARFLQLYTYHFPKTWSAACVANRELIKEAQRRAHALEHACTREALEWQLRFFFHYFRVFRCGEQPEPGMKRYSRFYQYTYVAIYRQLKAAQQAAQEPAHTEWPSCSGSKPAEEVTFDPIDYRPLRARRTYPLQRAISANTCEESLPRAPIWQVFHKIVT